MAGPRQGQNKLQGARSKAWLRQREGVLAAALGYGHIKPTWINLADQVIAIIALSPSQQQNLSDRLIFGLRRVAPFVLHVHLGSQIRTECRKDLGCLARPTSCHECLSQSVGVK